METLEKHWVLACFLCVSQLHFLYSLGSPTQRQYRTGWAHQPWLTINRMPHRPVWRRYLHCIPFLLGVWSWSKLWQSVIYLHAPLSRLRSSCIWLMYIFITPWLVNSSRLFLCFIWKCPWLVVFNLSYSLLSSYQQDTFSLVYHFWFCSYCYMLD